ncbi:MAG: TIGR00725 family protein [Actinobacteria bacterium]|nr:TIGR00725 family protein [Actinomycetota bacterium]
MIKIEGKIIKISVIGGSSCEIEVFNQAYEVGMEIARNDAILVCGGLTGVMEACCKGAKDAGGLTIGVLPADDENSANKYVDIKIPTGMGYARNVLVVKSGHAVIAIDGSFGTLSEIGYALSYGKPLIGLNTWKIEPYCEEIEHQPQIIIATSPAEAVKIAVEKAKTVLGITA